MSGSDTTEATWAFLIISAMEPDLAVCVTIAVVVGVASGIAVGVACGVTRVVVHGIYCGVAGGALVLA